MSATYPPPVPDDQSCPAKSGDGWAYECTLAADHEGDHVAHGGVNAETTHVCHTWPQVRCSTCRDTGKVECAEPDGSGLYDQACPDCDAPYPVTGDPDAEDPFATPARQPEGA